MPKCATCRQPLTGAHVKALGAAYHRECFTCASCRRPLDAAFVVDEGRPFHPTCLICKGCGRAIGDAPFCRHNGERYHVACDRERHAPRCRACGAPVDAGISALDATWHPACFTCAGCGRPFEKQRFVPKDGQAFHEACYHARFTPRCDICRKPMTDAAVEDMWGHRYCRAHGSELQRCFSCSRLICTTLTGGGSMLSDGRPLCGICAETAVVDPRAALAILEDMRATLAGLGLPTDGHEIPFRLVDEPSLLRCVKRRRRRRTTLGLARHALRVDGHGKITARNFEEILILYGLPEEQFRTVAVHELTHAWLFFNRFDRLPERVEEGLCTLMEYLYLSQLTTPEAAVRRKQLAANDDPVYGRGFREAHKAMKAKTLPGLLRYVHARKRFPGTGLLSLFTRG